LKRRGALPLRAEGQLSNSKEETAFKKSRKKDAGHPGSETPRQGGEGKGRRQAGIIMREKGVEWEDARGGHATREGEVSASLEKKATRKKKLL